MSVIMLHDVSVKMDTARISSIASAWIRLHQTHNGSQEHEQLFWAFEELSDLIQDDPESGWLVLCEICKMDGNDWMLANVGAGPLEDLMVRYGNDFIDRVEETAGTNASFRKALGAVWKSDILDHVWDRIRMAAGPQF